MTNVIKVEVTLNNNLKFIRYAVEMEETGKGNYRYVLDDGTEVTHRKDLGYLELAQRILTR